MTLQKLKSKLVSINQTGYGHWRVTFERYGREISGITTNSLAIDRINSEDYESAYQPTRFYTTVKQAYSDLYNEVVRANK